MIPIRIKIKSICSDGSSDYNTVIQIYYFVITFTELDTKKIMSVLTRMGDGEIYRIFSIFKFIYIFNMNLNLVLIRS